MLRKLAFGLKFLLNKYLPKKIFLLYLKSTLKKVKKLIFLSSSMAEHSAVNRRVVGSSPTWGVFYWAFSVIKPFPIILANFSCKETGQYRKGELGSKPMNSKVLYANSGFQKSPVCPISINFKSGKSQNLYADMP